MQIVWIILAALVAGAAGACAGFLYRKNVIEKKIGRTEEYAKNLLEDAQRKADEKKKETILEAKEEVLRLKTELDRECRERRAEVQRSERRIVQREETLDKKMDNLEAREESLNAKYKEAEALEAEAQKLHDQQQGELERISNMTMEEARQILMDRIQKDAYHDAALIVRDIESRAKEEADRIAAEKKAEEDKAAAEQAAAEQAAAEKEAAEALRSHKGTRVFMVNMDEISSVDQNLASSLFDAFDMSVLPFLIQSDASGKISRRYFSLLE